MTHLEARAYKGKNVPRQSLRCVSSSDSGLYHNKMRWDKILEETTRPESSNLDSPSAAQVRSSELWNIQIVN